MARYDAGQDKRFNIPLCDRHWREAARRWHKANARAGLCWRCGEPRKESPTRNCPECRELVNIQKRAYNQRTKTRGENEAEHQNKLEARGG